MTERTKTGQMLRALVAMVVVLSVGGPPSAHALVGDLGSDGSDGPLNITVDTVLPLPPDGVIHATTIDVAGGATLSFSFSGVMHPGVILLATGDVVIDGTVDVSGGASTAGAVGAAGPGGTPGGAPAFGINTPSQAGLPTNGLIPSVSGASLGLRPLGGAGGTGTRCRRADPAGAPGAGGGGGGGAILIVSNTRIAGVGTVTASGGALGSAVPAPCAAGHARPGSPGADGRIRLMAPTVDLGGAALVAKEARLDAWQVVAAPTITAGADASTLGLRLGQELTRVPTPLPAPSIVAVDGASVTPASYVPLLAGAPGATITVHVDGCTRGPMTARVYAVSRDSGACTCAPEETVVAAPTGSDDVDVPFSFSTCSCGFVDSAMLFPSVRCGPASSP